MRSYLIPLILILALAVAVIAGVASSSLGAQSVRRYSVLVRRTMFASSSLALILSKASRSEVT